MAGKFERVSFAFNGTTVYDALFLKDKVPTYFTGCSATILKVIEKKAIPQDQYFFASYTAKNGYKECSAEYKARRLLIKAVWVEQNVPGFGAAASTVVPAPAKPVKVYQPAPPLLYLEDSEKFRDEAGEAIQIEVRGERHWKGIWFKARDVEKMLELSDIAPVLTHSTSSYVVGKDFDTFSLNIVPKNPLEREQIKVVQKPMDKSKTAMFLSYSGLVRMLVTRRHPIAERFQDWAFEKLFTLQHGTEADKQELAADVLGITTKALRAFLDTSVTSVPAIYLFQLGTVKEVREALKLPTDKYPDEHVVFKYGLSKDLKRRTAEHERTYGRLKGAMLTLTYHAYIDTVYLSEAETKTRDFFTSSGWALEHEKYKELTVVPPNLVKTAVHNQFTLMGEKYAGKLAELQQALRDAQSHIERDDAMYTELKQQYEARIEEMKERISDLKEQQRMLEELNAIYRQK